MQRPGFHFDPARLRNAAVLVPLIDRPDGVHVLLTRRSEFLNKHAGQVSFPGGRIEPSDATPLAAALRETEEEIGLAAPQIQVLGGLPRYPTITGFMIHPYVGFVRESGLLVPQPEEVAEIFEVPLGFLLDPANHRPHQVEHQGRTYHVDAMPYGEYFIWGATAAIFRAFYDRLRAGAPELLPASVPCDER